MCFFLFLVYLKFCRHKEKVSFFLHPDDLGGEDE